MKNQETKSRTEKTTEEIVNQIKEDLKETYSDIFIQRFTRDWLNEETISIKWHKFFDAICGNGDMYLYKMDILFNFETKKVIEVSQDVGGRGIKQSILKSFKGKELNNVVREIIFTMWIYSENFKQKTND